MFKNITNQPPVARVSVAEQNQQNYLEYGKLIQSEYQESIKRKQMKENLKNTKKERLEKSQDSGRAFTEHRHKKYEQDLATIAKDKCKSKKEWEIEDADDIRTKASGLMTQKSAMELLERSRDKAERYAKSEDFFQQKINKTTNEICKTEQELSTISPNQKKKQRSLINKIKHKKSILADLKYRLQSQEIKSIRNENKSMKWLGITEKIKESETAKLIAEEKKGIGNKYGFNPLAQDRGNTDHIHKDFYW